MRIADLSTPLGFNGVIHAIVIVVFRRTGDAVVGLLSQSNLSKQTSRRLIVQHRVQMPLWAANRVQSQ